MRRFYFSHSNAQPSALQKQFKSAKYSFKHAEIFFLKKVQIKQHLNIALLTLDWILECCVVKKHSNKTRIAAPDCMAIGCPSASLLSLGTFWTGSMAPPFQRHTIKVPRNEHIAYNSIIFPDKFSLINVLFKRFQPKFLGLSQGCGIWAKSWWLHRKSTYLGICTWDVLENWQNYPQHRNEVSASRDCFPMNIWRSAKTFQGFGCSSTSVWHSSAHRQH